MKAKSQVTLGRDLTKEALHSMEQSKNHVGSFLVMHNDLSTGLRTP